MSLIYSLKHFHSFALSSLNVNMLGSMVVFSQLSSICTYLFLKLYELIEKVVKNIYAYLKILGYNNI